MASNRKLQGEIDRVLKAITEHMQEFDQIWQKVHTAPTPNLKEKYEGDLKKQIKKLQRFRDQIKSWAASNDIKNKKPLLDARKAIETEMERFKILEKETKTKAYSKEGLSGVNKRGRLRTNSDGELIEHMDPREDPTKRDTFMWLDDIEEQLQQQLTEMEEKMEGLKATSKKKKSTAATTDQMTDDLQHKMDRHTYHIEQLQTIKDRLEHDELEIKLVEDIHDDLDYYLNSNNEADFQEDETLYDSLELDKEQGSDEEATEEADSEPITLDTDLPEEEAADEEEEAAPSGTVSAIFKNAGAKATPTKATTKTQPAAKSTPTTTPTTASSTSKPNASPVSTAAASTTAANLVKGRTGPTAAVPTPVASPPLTVPSPAPSKAGESLASIIAKNQKTATVTPTPATPATVPAQPSTKPATPAAASTIPPVSNTPKPTTTPTPLSTTTPPSTVVSPPPSTTPTPTAALAANSVMNVPTQPKPTGGLPMIAPTQLGRLPPGQGVAGAKATGTMMPPPGLSSSQTPPPGLGTGVGGPPTGNSAAELSGLPSTNLLSGGSSTLFPHKDRTLVPDDYMLTLSLLEPSLRHLPDPLDSDRPKQYIPRNPFRTPTYFPSVPAPIFDDPLLFDKLSVDTLFFIFYFQQGTPHQYLAARELKKQSWRYHKNFLTWFQRHDDPKNTTEEFEQGTYVYFDYESGWCQRIKADFTFEYRHLEDELQVPVAAAL